MLFNRQARRSLRVLHARSRAPRGTPWGFELFGPEALTTGFFEPNETVLLRGLMAQSDIVVNVGAHVGYYCCHALSMGKSVIAVEPNPDNLYDLIRNIHRNRWARRAEIFPVAVGESADILEMWGAGTAASVMPGWAGNSKLHSACVPVLSLDRIAADAVRGRKALFIVDVEGAEHLALRGAVQCLEASPRPVWMVEITDTTHRPAHEPLNPNLIEVFGAFLQRGYRCVTADGRGETIDLDRVQLATLGHRLPAHNFLFS